MVMATVPVTTYLNINDYMKLQTAMEMRKVTLYVFIKEAIHEKMQREGI